MSTDHSNTPAAPSFTKLNEHNYHTWKFDMQALLMLMQNAAWLIVNGTMEEPSNRSTQEWKNWQLANMNAAGVIYS